MRNRDGQRTDEDSVPLALLWGHRPHSKQRSRDDAKPAEDEKRRQSDVAGNGISASDFVPDVSRVRPRLHVRQVPFEVLRDRFVVALILVGVGLGERRYRLVEDRLTAKITRD
jgi:hypothetical protein